MSAALTAGAAALVLSHQPQLTPDELKQRLIETATPLAGASSNAVGAGVVNAGRLTGAATPEVSDLPAARPGNGPALGHWDGRIWDGRIWDGRIWDGRIWDGRVWDGRVWDGRVWDGRIWNGRIWNGRIWNGRTWN